MMLSLSFHFIDSMRDVHLAAIAGCLSSRFLSSASPINVYVCALREAMPPRSASPSPSASLASSPLSRSRASSPRGSRKKKTAKHFGLSVEDMERFSRSVSAHAHSVGTTPSLSPSPSPLMVSRSPSTILPSRAAFSACSAPVTAASTPRHSMTPHPPPSTSRAFSHVHRTLAKESLCTSNC